MMPNKELLFSVTKKDFTIEWYSGTGAGGQHRNKHQNCCRIKHVESKSTGTGTESKSRDRNLKMAFKRLTGSDKFQSWVKRKAAMSMVDAKTIEEIVDEQMKPENIKIETGL